MNKQRLIAFFILLIMSFGVNIAVAEPYTVTIFTLPKAGEVNKTRVGAAAEAENTIIQINLQNAFKDAGAAFTAAFKERKLIFADYEPYDAKTKKMIPWTYANFPQILIALADGNLEFQSKK